MKLLCKKIIALIVIAFIVIRTVLFSSLTASAMFAGPATAEALEVFLEAVLVATGAVSSSQLDSLDFNQKQTILSDGLNSGSISKNDFLLYATDPGLLFVKGYIENADIISLVQIVVDKVISNWLDDCFSDYEVLGDVLSPAIDLKGYGALAIEKGITATHNITTYYYDDYITVALHPSGQYYTYTLEHPYIIVYRNSDGSYISERQQTYRQVLSYVDPTYQLSVYGDVRWSDTGELASDSEAYVDTASDENTVVGTLDDGTEVTAGDLISGAVDPSDVKPKYDAFTDSVLSDLIGKLLSILSDSSSVTDSSDLTDKVIDDVGDVTLELEGLDGLMVPSSVAHVFPFCLPWDFVQGMYLFKSEPEVPKFSFDIDVPSFLGVPEQHWNIDVDFSQFETLAKITRWGFMVLFVYTLILLTGKIVKGAGA